MAIDPSTLQGLFAKNRAEELGHDVWEHFVVPPFYGRLDLTEAKKPRVIIGGRGCGKTMLLRYLSHESVFSPNRRTLPEHALQHIGLYWRSDTQFANAMVHRDQPEDVWESSFHHLLALALGMELIRSLRNLAGSPHTQVEPEDIVRIDFSRLQAMDDSLPKALEDLEVDLETRWWTLQAWVNDVRKNRQPRFLPGRHFLLALISVVKAALPQLSQTIFFAYIDEYENLRDYQRKIIHTYMKHSEAAHGLIVNLAVKKNVLGVPETLGPEPIASIHDLRLHDLELYLQDDFSLFAAEILLLHLSNAHMEAGPIEPEKLRDPSYLDERRSPLYERQVLAHIRNRFPDVTEDDLANGVFNDHALSRKLRSRIERALQRRQSTVPPESFFRPQLAKATIIVPALLNRQSLTPERVLAEMDQLDQNEENRFTGAADWIHNNFIGCLLQLYEPHSRPCPFYAGFNSFCSMAHGNIRHMLEMCHKSVQQALRDPDDHGTAVQPRHEATAARIASAAFLGEIRSFGRFGNQLHSFVLRLGSLFALAHERPSQSEPEVTHFAIVAGTNGLGQEDWSFLREAIKWSVLFDEPQTKKKQDLEPEDIDYVLNPIYAPYFHISYRKRRSLTLPSDDIVTLIRGEYEDVRRLLRRYSDKWSVDLDERPTLFSHLQEEGSST